LGLHNAAALEQAHDDQDERDYKQRVDQSAERDRSEKSQGPENDQDYNYCPHIFSPPFFFFDYYSFFGQIFGQCSLYQSGQAFVLNQSLHFGLFQQTWIKKEGHPLFLVDCHGAYLTSTCIGCTCYYVESNPLFHRSLEKPGLLKKTGVIG
jgi:hypothetical protein